MGILPDPEHPPWCSGPPLCTVVATDQLGAAHRSAPVTITAGTLTVSLSLMRAAPGHPTDTYLLADIADVVAATMSIRDGWALTDALTGMLERAR
jgi:hypothetical protein